MRWEKEAGEVEVIVGSDRGGQCQASFRIHSLRSSCYIFYCRNKRMACYFHMRAIFLRAAAKETRWKQESVQEKQNSSFSNTKTADMKLSAHSTELVVCTAGSQPVIVWVKSHLRWIARRIAQTLPDKSIPNILFYFCSNAHPLKKILFWQTCPVSASSN